MNGIGKLCIVMVLWLGAAVQAAELPEGLGIYFGTTHGHTSFSGDAAKNNPTNNTPAIHYAEARRGGFQFYCVTDHSQYDTFTTQTFKFTQQEAQRCTDKDFVALWGFEYSENDGPGGKGHMNVFNTPDFLNALAKGNDLNVFHEWLVEQGKHGVVMASMNHPGAKQYDNFGYYSDARREMVTLFEVINGSKSDPATKLAVGSPHYKEWIIALDKGWRVAPVAGLDAHSSWSVSRSGQFTAVLAKALTREGLLEGMKARRTYASYDRNLRAYYTANGAVMGAVLDKPARLKFEIRASDPDQDAPKDKITKIEIVSDGGAVVQSKDFDAHEAKWDVELDATGKYYFVNVYTADKPESPTACLAPVWTGR